MSKQQHRYEVGDEVYVGHDRYDGDRATGRAIVTKVFPGTDYDTFIEVQFMPDLVTLDRVRPVADRPGTCMSG